MSKRLERERMKEGFHHQHLYPFVDVCLTSKEKVKDLDLILQEKALFWTDKPVDVVAKLSTAKVFYLYPDSYDQWTDILLEIQQRRSLPVKLILLCDSDIRFCLDHLEIMFAFFPQTEFWIQNWLGYHPQATLLPLGCFNHMVIQESKEKPSQLTISFGNTYIGCEARETFAKFVQKTKELEPYILPSMPHRDYCKLVSLSLYHTCPMGEGPDTFRFWESLMLGTIPVVKDDDFYDFVEYHYPDIPILRLKQWGELIELLPFLQNQPLPSMPYLERDYWLDKIKAFKE